LSSFLRGLGFLNKIEPINDSFGIEEYASFLIIEQTGELKN